MDNTEKKELITESSNNEKTKNTKNNTEVKLCNNKELNIFHELLLRGFEIYIKNRKGTGSWKKRILYLGNNGNDCPKLIIERDKKLINDGTEKGIELQDIGHIYNTVDKRGKCIVHIIRHSTTKHIVKYVRDYHILFPSYNTSCAMVTKMNLFLKTMGFDVKSKLKVDVL